ncbi:hypothetical protein OsI_05795 [Oryza sativa Indica Group]|uniref:Uncharacterized protein n=2 Tax=Oryza TaxID=4527 RepID=A0A0E0G0Z4_ORYNI|nr:hypothetical protein OsI_05795 [Oryza sativa Indica Group]
MEKRWASAMGYNRIRYRSSRPRLFGFSYMGTHVNVETWFRIKDMALKASGTCWHCKPCVGSSAAGASHWHHPYHQGGGFGDSDAASGSEQFLYMYHSTSTP